MKEGTKKINLNVIGIILIAIAVMALVILVVFFLNGRESNTTTKKDDMVMSALVCNSGSRDDAFFISETAQRITHEVKITFNNKKMGKIFYHYEGVYNSDDIAKKDEGALRAKYNIYMGENGVPIENLKPSYSVAKSKLGISLYAESYELITTITEKFFFIGEDEIDEYGSRSVDELKKFYEDKQFVCQIHG